jgi:CopG family transcriptional regulator/antitoxin EndoAI
MPEEFFRQAEKLAKEENRTRSELYREAVRQYIETRRWQKLQRETAERARKLGITSEEDVERIQP